MELKLLYKWKYVFFKIDLMPQLWAWNVKELLCSYFLQHLVKIIYMWKWWVTHSFLIL